MLTVDAGRKGAAFLTPQTASRADYPATRRSQPMGMSERSSKRAGHCVKLGTHGQPDDIGTAVVFLASDAAAYVTGQVLIVDGGGRM
ncbi:MAG: SDR family oxidoreductase [Gemmataceae bacterium]